jgi:hypothetical protein
MSVLRWIQQSLFGPKDETPEPRGSVKASRPAPRKAPLKTSRTSSLPDTFLARWRALCPRDDVDVALVARLRQGWRIEWKRGERARLRVPAAFLTAPDAVVGALGQWAGLALQRRSPQRNAARKELERTLHAWLESHAAHDARSQTLTRGRAARRLDRLQPQGRHHDLEAILAAINREYFGGALEARITWSRRWGGLSTQSHAKDADGGRYALITISRGYDHPSATADIVGGVVYHECLHIAVPPHEASQTEGGGRRVVHGREFRRREKEYRFYAEWRKWHAEQLPRIIRRGDPKG